MEPVEGKVKEVYAITTKVAAVKSDANGFWIRYEGSWEFLYVGFLEPMFSVGDEVKIIFEKVNPNEKAKAQSCKACEADLQGTAGQAGLGNVNHPITTG